MHAGYSLTANAAISGHNKKKVSGGLDACKKACDNEGSFICKSFDYDKGNGTCDLSDKTATEVGGLKTDYPGNPYDHYAKTLTTDPAHQGSQLFDSTKSLRASYSCKQPTGKLDCSNPLNDPSAKFWKTTFEPACKIHDLCYSAPWRISGTSGWKGQRECDEAFKQNMEAICKTRPNAERLDCFTQKTAFHLAVKDWGATSFNSGQATAEKLCGQKAKDGTIRFFNSGGYVAEFTLMYTEIQKIKSGNTYIDMPMPKIKQDSLSLGKWVEWYIPEGSINIVISAKTRTGREIFTENWGNEPKSECRKVYGVVFNPKFNKVCELFEL